MLTTIFILSGIAIAILLVSKRIEEKKRKSVFILSLISKGDEHARALHHEAVRFYSLSKERAEFLLRKQLPRYSRSSINKVVSRVEERLDKHFHSIRDSRLLKKSEGISEFFKTMSEVEKGGGELHDDLYMEETGEVIAAVDTSEPVIEVNFEATEPLPSPLNYGEPAEQTSPAPDAQPKPKRARKPSAKRKLKVTSEETEQFI